MKVSAFDRFLMALAPRWGLNRVRARMAVDAVTTLRRNYEAAQPGRRTQGWARNFGDADVTLRGAAVELRAHARDLVRNNGWARRGQRVIANNTVGWGIVPKAVGVPEAVATKAAMLWKRWAESKECESEGRHTFYGIQALCMRAVSQDGEFFLRRRPRRKTDNLTIPLQLQVMEADFLDHNRNFFDDRGWTIQGVEFNKLGRRTAYWLYRTHPGSGRNAQVSERVPASEVLHIYYTERPGQTRGVSWFGSAVVPLKDFDEYEDATLMKQKIAACFAAFVTDMDGGGATIGDPDASDSTVELLEPGMIEELPPGKQVTFGNPPSVTEEGFSSRTLRKIASALGVTYEDLTGDYSDVNFSSARMSRIAHYQNVRDWQWNMVIPLLCQGVWDWAMQAAVDAGEIPDSAIPGSEWSTPPMPMIEPEKEGLAYQRLVRTGAMTHAQMVREQGGDPDSHWAEYADGLKQLDALGIKLDSDVRAVTQVGQEQASETAILAPATPAKKPPPSK